MRVPPTSRRHMDELRRYFPVWADLVLEGQIELEADRNSYLAGGYAEEFGYRAQPGCSRGVLVLDSPEQCAESQMRAQATHPGYPLKPHPFEEELMLVRELASARQSVAAGSETPCVERARIERVIAREGREQAKEWARRTAAQYRAAVLDPEHFAHTGARRRQFIEAYLELKRFAERG